MAKLSGAEIGAFRRMINSDRTSDVSKKSFEQILEKYNVPIIEPKKTESAEKTKIKEQISKMENILKYSEDKEKIKQIINSLKTALKYVWLYWKINE